MTRKISLTKLAAIIGWFTIFFTAGYSQTPAEQTVDARTQEQMKIIMAHLLENIYVSPEIGQRLGKQMQAKFESGAYREMPTPAQLAEALTRDLRELGKDRHLYVRYNPAAGAGENILTPAEWEKMKSAMFSRRMAAAAPPANRSERDVQMASQLQQANYHFREAKYLGGNIGYLDLGGFAPGQSARDTAAQTMARLANSEALIIDLRRCPGGSAEMVNFLASYFFEKEPRVLMTRYIRPTDETVESKTIADIPGKRMLDTDLYLLVSSATASACESFPYILQQFGRAKIVGERTAGAGYNNALIPIGKGFSFSVSYGRPTHPRSGKGWEGEGVQPDITVPADKALETAQKEALLKLIAKTVDETRKNVLVSALQNVGNTSPSPNPKPSQSGLQDYVGKYGNKEISVQDGGLFYQRIGGRGAALRATGTDKFALNADAQLTFIRDTKNTVTEMLIDWVGRDKEQLKREVTAAAQPAAGSANQTQVQPPLTEAEREVRKLEREWLNAYEQRDVEAMNRIVADDFKLTLSNGTVQTKADILAQIKGAPDTAAVRPTVKFSTEEVQSRVSGETVILTGKVTQSMERGGQTRSMQSRYIDTYVKREGRWQVAASQMTRIP